MKVRDILSNVQYDAKRVMWILGENGGHTTRDRAISLLAIQAFSCPATTPAAEPWAEEVDGSNWVPVEIIHA